jgi:hypothetical protein
MKRPPFVSGEDKAGLEVRMTPKQRSKKGKYATFTTLHFKGKIPFGVEKRPLFRRQNPTIQTRLVHPFLIVKSNSVAY